MGADLPHPLRFLFAAKPLALSQVLGVVYRAISTFLIKMAGFAVASGAKAGAVTLIQRFGSALKLNIHFHMPVLDGMYSFDRAPPRSHRARRPTPAELARLLHTIIRRVAWLLERQGLLVRDPEHDYPDFEPGEALEQLIGASIHYRLAIGPNGEANQRDKFAKRPRNGPHGGLRSWPRRLSVLCARNRGSRTSIHNAPLPRFDRSASPEHRIPDQTD